MLPNRNKFKPKAGVIHDALAITVLLISITMVNSQIGCNTSDVFKNCVSCNSSLVLAYNTTSNLATCTSLMNCTVVTADNKCLQCTASTLETNTSTCLNTNPFCRVMTNGICIQCIQSNYYLNQGNCSLQILPYCWVKSASGCQQCSQSEMSKSSNCSIPLSICQIFDYQQWKCLTCPTTLLMHNSNIYCYSAINGCLVYTSTVGLCLQCKLGYYRLGNGSSCQLGVISQINVELDIISSGFSLTGIDQQYITICLDNSKYYNPLSFACVSTTNITFCKSISNSACSQCNEGFYLTTASSIICMQCSYSSCLNCTSTFCNQCVSGYYLMIENVATLLFALQGGAFKLVDILNYHSTVISYLNSNNISVVTTCMPCSIYFCLSCNNVLADDNNDKVICYQCMDGYTLSDGVCFQCSGGMYYSISLKSCTNCTVQYCQYCTATPNVCSKCLPTYYYDALSSSCRLVESISNGSVVLSSSNVYQYLSKVIVGIDSVIVNDNNLLVSSCNGSSNGYGCLCSENITANIYYTSLCNVINSSIFINSSVAATYSNVLGNVGLNAVTWIPNLQLYMMLSELPTYNYQYVMSSSIPELISEIQFATLLQIHTNRIKRETTISQSNRLSNICNMTFNNMKSVFQPYTTTILSGPGYYYKYRPSTSLADNTSFVYLTQNTTNKLSEMIYVYFNSTVDSSFPRITGTVYACVYNSSTNLLVSSTVQLTIKKTSFIKSNQVYSLYENNLPLSTTVTSTSDGFMSIGQATTFTNAANIKSYYVSSSAGSVTDVYAPSRIQNIFYQESYIYILVFIFLYLLLMPLCAIFDFADRRGTIRKNAEKMDDQPTSNEDQQSEDTNQEKSHQEEIIIKINYKDFFPIYNVANTPRPRRLLKLSLLIVNWQHGITFLTLIYFNLSPGNSIAAVLLSIPAYICTIIMGYICGLFTLKIPGNSKYLINLLSLAYWIIWVAVMSKFVSPDYKPFVYIFAAIFVILDIIIDLLETFLMYFTIKQEQKQIRLFQSLSRWFSYRGFYEFNEMANMINEAREEGE